MSLRLLCFGPKEVVPPDDGGKEGIHGALAALAKKADVTYAYPAGPAAAASAGYSAIGVRALPVDFLPRESAGVLAASLVTLRPYKFAKYATARAVDRFAAALRSLRFDAVVCFHAHVVRLAERILERRGERAPIILREHNIEYALVESYARHASPPLRAAARAYAWITRREEHSLWRRVNAVALLSDADLASARGSGVRANFLLAPEGVPLPPRREARWPGRGARLLLLFNPRVPQNVVNLRIFFRGYWRAARRAGRLQESALAVTGVDRAGLARLLGVAPAELDALGVQALGFVDSLPGLFASSLALVSPTFVGAGVRKKVLEAMAHQLPVIATPLDAGSASFYRPGVNLLCMEDAAGFAAAVERLAGSPDSWQALSRAGRGTVERHASWDRFADALLAEAACLVEARRGGGGA